MTEQPILTEQRGNILIITINRPHVRNAMNADAARQLTDAIDMMEAEASIHIGILTGAGECFSAGADLKVAAIEGRSGAATERGPMGICQRPPSKPMIAAVEGFALGGGFEMVLTCDLVVAAEDARMGLPEVRYNLIANGGGLLRLPRRIPANIATEVALAGVPYPAEFFYRHGLINRMVAPGTAVAAAIEFAAQLILNGPTALAATANILRRAADWTEEQGWLEQRHLAAFALQSEDRREGVRAFAEKRAPVWQGR